MGEGLPRGGRIEEDEAQEAVRPSFHDLSQREGAADEFRWVGIQAQNRHDAVCSPQGVVEDSKGVRGGYYSQSGIESVGFPPAISMGLIHFLVVRNLDPEDNLVFLDPGEEDKTEAEVDMAADGEDLGVAADVQKIHYMARASGSTPGLVAAYLRLEVEEDSCATYGSRMAAYGGRGLVVVDRKDWSVRA